MHGLLILLQAASAPMPSALDGFDLRQISAPASRACDSEGSSRSSDIVVCGVRETQAPPEDGKFQREPTIPRAEVSLGGPVRGSVDLEQVEFPDGNVSRRIMVRVKMPF